MFGNESRDSPKHQSSLFHWQFQPGLRVRIIKGEITADDGDGHRKNQDTTHCARAAHYLPWPRLWRHVSVADCCHGDEAPPEGYGDGREGWVLVLHDELDVVDDAGEEDYGDKEHEEQKHQLVRTCFERVDYDLKSVWEFDETKESENANHQKHLHDVGPNDEVNIEWDDGQEVDPIHGRPHELEFRRAEHEAHDELYREEDAADGFHFAYPFVVSDRLAGPHLWQGADAEGCNWQTDEETWEVRHELEREREKREREGVLTVNDNE